MARRWKNGAATEALIVAWLRETGKIHVRTNEVEVWCRDHWYRRGIRRQPSTWARALWRVMTWIGVESQKKVQVKDAAGNPVEVMEYRLTKRILAEDVDRAFEHPWSH